VNVTAERRPGRPRSATADQAILDAALELFVEAGLEGLTVEQVAARAGVGKATIYRRYPGKVDLVIAAARCLTSAAAPNPDTGTVDGDLRAIARGLVRLLTETEAGRAVAQVVAEVQRNADLRRAHAEFVATRREGTIDAVKRGMARGELRADTEPEMVADLLTGPIFYRHLVSGGRLDPAYADRLVDQVLTGRRACISD
jgi:AcrR family transcriptional regulator